MKNPEHDNSERKKQSKSDSEPVLRRFESDKPPGKSGLIITYGYPDMTISPPIYVIEGECDFRPETLDDGRDYSIASVAPEEPGLANIYKIDLEDLPTPSLRNLAGACEADNLLAVLQIGDCAHIELTKRGLNSPDTLKIEYYSADDQERKNL
jgi:hypothetical protein